MIDVKDEKAAKKESLSNFQIFIKEDCLIK